MSAKHRTPILLDSQILAAIIEDTLTIAGADKALKPQVLNRAAARLTGPKFNWGRITGSSHPILAQTLAEGALDATLDTLMERPTKAGSEDPTLFGSLRDHMTRQGVPVRNMPWSDVAPEDIMGLPKLEEPEQLAEGFNAYFRSDNPFAMITGDLSAKIAILQQQACRKGHKVTTVSLDEIADLGDLAKIAPKPGTITLYSDISEIKTDLMVAAMKQISHEVSHPHHRTNGVTTKVIFLAGDSDYNQDIIAATIPQVSSQTFSAGDKTRSERVTEAAQDILDFSRTAAMIGERDNEIISHIEPLAKRQGIDLAWPCLKDVRFQTICDVGEGLPQPGCLTIYTDLAKADDETLRAICKSIISSWDKLDEPPARVLFQVDDPENLSQRLHRLEPKMLTRWYGHQAD